MSKDKITINDFNLFIDVTKALTKFAEAAQLSISEDGLEVYSKNQWARCEIQTNAISSEKPVKINIGNLQTFMKILQTIKDVHEDDYSNFNFFIDLPAIKFESKKIKTKLLASSESETVEKWVSTKVTTLMKPVFEFNTTSDMIRRLNNHTFISSNPESLRIYLGTDAEMENNVIYASIGNNSNDLNNMLKLKFGLVTFGTLNDRQLTIDFNRLNIFNVIPSNEIKIQLMDKNVLLSTVKVQGKNDTYFNINVYNSLRKN